MSPKENKGIWTSFVKSGANFLKFVSNHTEKIEDKKEILSSGKSKVVAEILGKIGELHWVAGELSIVAYLMEKCHQVSVNKAEGLQLLKNMVDLATTVAELRDVIPERHENLKSVVMLFVQGSMMCVSQIYSENTFSFFKASVNSESLKAMSDTLDHLYRDLTLAISTIIAKRQFEMEERQSEMARRQSILLPMPKPFYPKHAGGIENAREEDVKLLSMTSESTVAVVIYGFGGMGKTSLATSVVAMLDLNYLVEKQQQILSDAFPNFHVKQNQIKRLPRRPASACGGFQVREKARFHLY